MKEVRSDVRIRSQRYWEDDGSASSPQHTVLFFVLRSLRLAVCCFALCSSALAQPTAKIPRVGFLTATSLASIDARTEAFRQGLKELGYIEGKTIIIEERNAAGKLDRLRPLAAELIRLKVDIIVSAGPGDTRAAKDVTNTIPIIMAQDSDPVGNGFVASLARPGGNITGLATLAPEISGKRLELLHEAVSGITRVAVLGSSTRPGNAQALTEVERAARTLKMRLQYLDVKTAADLVAVFDGLPKERADAILVLEAPLFINERTRLAAIAAKRGVPAIYSRKENVEAGGLMSYGVSVTAMYHRAATYVDKILKGAKPGDLPVEQPTKFELVINLKTAKQIGVTIPPSVLARADKVIK